jgi:hypothetical protein
MGQPIVVTEKPSSYPGVVRFETNRALTGMGHERYVAGTEVWGDRPPDELARRLLAESSVESVQINSNIVTVDLAKGFDSRGLREVIENLYIFYPDASTASGSASVPAGTDATVAPEAPTEPAAASDTVTSDLAATAAPETFADPADAVAPETPEAPSIDAPAAGEVNAEPTAANPAVAPADADAS